MNEAKLNSNEQHTAKNSQLQKSEFNVKKEKKTTVGK